MDVLKIFIWQIYLFKVFVRFEKYSKTKIGNNFLPGLVSSNLNADLNLSILRKKAISKLKFYEHMILF